MSAATKAKIAAAQRGNKNAFKGGSASRFRKFRNRRHQRVIKAAQTRIRMDKDYAKTTGDKGTKRQQAKEAKRHAKLRAVIGKRQARIR